MTKLQKTTLLGAGAYTFATFPLAVLWHVVLFEDHYQAFGYFAGEPNFVLGLLNIVVQGLVLSFLYQFVRFQGQGVVRGLKYALFMGVFFWSIQVLAFVAKQTVSNAAYFVAMESVYVFIQFAVYGILIAVIDRKLSN